MFDLLLTPKWYEDLRLIARVNGGYISGKWRLLCCCRRSQRGAKIQGQRERLYSGDGGVHYDRSVNATTIHANGNYITLAWGELLY
jgi:hypothetical protein